MASSRFYNRVGRIFVTALIAAVACDGKDSTEPGDSVGTLIVAIVTTGETLDNDGYLLLLDRTDTVPAEPNDTLALTDLPAASHELELVGVAPNCSVTGSNPRTVQVALGDPVRTDYEVTCIFAIRNQIAFSSDRDGNFELYVMNPDGTGITRLTYNPANDFAPAISPDGTRIAFVSVREADTGGSEIFVMSASGGGPATNITNHPASDQSPAWSPDGNKIAFASDRDGDYELYVMNADGTSLQQLTENQSRDTSPSWSSDGANILFTSDREGRDDVYVMNNDGTSVTRLTFVSDNWWPSFSPDGTAIVFATWRYGYCEIAAMNRAGTAITRLTEFEAWSYYPAWSPDGSRIAFGSNHLSGDMNVYVMNADGSDTVNLTQSMYEHWDIQWSRW